MPPAATGALIAVVIAASVASTMSVTETPVTEQAVGADRNVPRSNPSAISPAGPPTSAPVIPADGLIATGRADLAGEVRQAVDAIVSGSEVGLAVFDRTSASLVCSLSADQQFYAASVIKLLIALDALNHTNATEEIAGAVHGMLARSDDEMANLLWLRGGRSAIVNRMAASLDLTGTVPPHDPSQWGEALTTAADVITVYRHIIEELPEPGRDLVLGALFEATRVAADGFDQYYGIPAGMPEARWAIKQGWMRRKTEVLLHSTVWWARTPAISSGCSASEG